LLNDSSAGFCGVFSVAAGCDGIPKRDPLIINHERYELDNTGWSRGLFK
jgi:hypothetical protein